MPSIRKHHPKSRFWVSVCTVFLLAVFAFPVKAADDDLKMTTEKMRAITEGDVSGHDEVNEDDVVLRYVPSSHENILRLIWLLKGFQFDDIDAITAYIKVSECSLYLKYFNDDFEWRKIQKATLDYLTKYSKSFSNYLEITQPIFVDRYDFDLRGFTLRNPQELTNVAALQLLQTKYGITKCEGVTVDSEKFTGTAVLKLKNTINISYIRASDKIAKAYLDFVQENRGALTQDKKIMYVRYRVRVDRYVGPESLPSIGRAQMFSGKLLQLDVFADQQLLLPIFSQKYE